MTDLNPVDNYLHGSWEALGNGAPMLVALAQLCSETWVNHSEDEQFELDSLSLEAQTILHAARNRGVIEIRAVNSAFEASARMLAVYVELDDARTVAFRQPSDPKVTLQFLTAFRELCSRGLILHHIYRDFSLSSKALEIGKSISIDKVGALLSNATEFGLHD